jgi:molybdopterin-guanine dinucleotide biosynthesis protein A
MEQISGIILAGGRARRMGGEDKGLSLLAGRPLVEHVIERLSPQLTTLVISANRNHAAYQQFGYAVLSDRDGDFQGPLAGIASAIAITESPLLLVTPCDTPLLPENLVARLQQTLEQSQRPIAVAHDGERLQQLCFLARRSILGSITTQLNRGERRVRHWINALQPAITHFNAPLAFSNINTAEERQQMEQVLQERR